MHVDLRYLSFGASANALADLSEDKAQFEAWVHAFQTVRVALQVALFNSATCIVYQTQHDFLVSSFVTLAFVGFACHGPRGRMAGLATFAHLSPPIFGKHPNGGAEFLAGQGCHWSGRLYVNRIAPFMAW
jgi:hypothetical protein